MSDPIDEAWARLSAEWGEDDAHRKFIGLCATMGRLPEAGRRYREIKDSDPDEERRRIAEQQIDRLLAHAMKSLEVHRTRPTRRPLMILFWVATVLTLGMILAVTWMIARGS